MSLAIALSGIALDLLLTVKGDEAVRMVTKPLTIFLIANYALTQKSGRANIRALILCAIGDVLLLNAKKNMYYGAFFFSLGHIHFAHEFWQKYSGMDLEKCLPLIPMLTVSYVLIMNSENPTLKMMGMIYSLFLGMMILTALATDNGYLHIGAILFFISDSLIMHSTQSKDNFETPIMVTYWAAQMLIQYGLAQHKKKIQ